MNIWHPAPRGLINTAATERWSRKRQAPEIVVYLWIWSQRDEGAPPTRRQVAKIFGWTEHASRNMIERVKRDMNEWRLYISPRGQTGQRPARPSKNNTLERNVAQKTPRNNPVSPDHARVPTQQQQHNTETETDVTCLERMPEWLAIK